MSLVGPQYNITDARHIAMCQNKLEFNLKQNKKQHMINPSHQLCEIFLLGWGD